MEKEKKNKPGKRRRKKIRKRINKQTTTLSGGNFP
jgi:hypothetical protein